MKNGFFRGTEVKMEMKFYKCAHCGKIIAVVKDTRVPVTCCGEKMSEIIPCSVDAAVEKHVPVYTVEGNVVTVKVGSVLHPMLAEHLIEWVAVKTNFGNQRKSFVAGDAPEKKFALLDGEVVEEVYAYCNLHGLWKA